MSFSLTVTKIDFQTMPSVTRDFSGHEINNLRPSTEGNTSSAAIFEDANGRTIYVTQTYSAVQTSKTNDMAEAGAELQSNKDATGGYAGLTLFKINFKNVANTFTSFFTNTNTAARTYTFQDRNGTIADDTDLALKAPLASPTFTGTPAAPTAAAGTNTTQIATTAHVAASISAKLVKGGGTLTAGVLTVSNANVGLTSVAVVQKVSLGGTVAAGGYKVAMNAGVGFTITALQVDGTTTETSNTDAILYILAI